jgi:hypothetical protein
MYDKESAFNIIFDLLLIMTSKGSTTTKVTGTYFEEKKKGEMNELKK